jgi:hypothetical protein
MADFTLKQGDIRDEFVAVLTDKNGVAVDLTAAVEIKLKMRPVLGGAMKVDAVAAKFGPDVGRVRYTWIAANVDTPGLYFAEFEVAWSGGAPQTFPQDGYLVVQIVPDLR